MKHRLLPAACTVLLTACLLTGCGASGIHEEYSAEQLPYGATVSEDASRSMTLSYDKRFLDDALVEKIYTYYHAVETKDGNAFASVMLPLYHEYQLNELYENTLTDQDIVERTYNAVKDYFGYDYDYSFIEVTDLISGLGQSGGRDSLSLKLDQLAQEKGIKAVSEETQHLYALTVTRYVDKKGSGTKTETSDSLTGETLYAIQYQNEWYLMY